MVPIWWQSNEIESSYHVYKAIVGHFSNVLAAILDMDHGKILQASTFTTASEAIAVPFCPIALVPQRRKLY